MKAIEAFFTDLFAFYGEAIRKLWKKRPRVKFHGPTNLNVKEWSRNRATSLVICVLIYGVLIVATLYSSIHFWGAAFKTKEVGYGFALLVDGLAVACLVFRICRVQFPLNWLRHALPLTTVIPVYVFAFDQLNDIALAIVVSVVILGFSFVLQHHIEGLFVSPEELAREAVMANAQGLLNEQLRRAQVDSVLGTFTVASRELSQAAAPQLGDGKMRREEFRRYYKVAVKFVTVAFQAYKAGENFDVYCNTAAKD